jgi:hypothetical protein
MLAARKQPTPWTGHGDAAVRVYGGLERGRPFPEQEPDADLVALILIHPDTEAPLTGTPHCPQALIHGTWTEAYRLLTHAFAGRAIDPDLNLEP